MKAAVAMTTKDPDTSFEALARVLPILLPLKTAASWRSAIETTTVVTTTTTNLATVSRSDDGEPVRRPRATARPRGGGTRGRGRRTGGGRRQNRRDDSDDSDEWTEDWDDVHRQEFSSRDGPSRVFAGEIDAIT